MTDGVASGRSGEISVLAPDGIGEVRPGTDLAAEVAAVLDLCDGDVVVVTSKIVSKAEGRIRPADEESYEAAFSEETVRFVARRGPTRIVRNRLGLVMAAAGIDRSNVEAGTIVLLPLDPDATARALRTRLHELTGACVGVVITDTAGRAWREGQTDIAIGVAGLTPAEEFAGREDAYGNPLAVTLPAVADEIAGAAELAQGKLGARPVARLRGRADLVLPLDEDGPGAASLQRAEGADLFGFGAREAVLTALSEDERWWHVFGAAATPDEFAQALLRVVPTAQVSTEDEAVVADLDSRTDATTDMATDAAPDTTALRAVAVSHGWRLVPGDKSSVNRARFQPLGP